MTLPPLANLLAIRSADPRKLDELQHTLKAAGEHEEFWRPTSQWLVAVRRLPDSSPDPAACRAAGLAFIQGREHFDPAGRWQDLADTAHDRPSTLARNPGDFAFLAFRPDHSVVAVRACGGVAPVYFWQGDEGAIVSTQMHALSRKLPHTPQLDLMVCAVWMCLGRSVFPDRRSFVQGVRVLSRGELAQLLPGQAPRYVQYWEPRPARYPAYSEQAEQAHVRQFREILLAHLQKHVPDHQLSMLALSGGVDSCALTALLVKQHKPLVTWTLLPSNAESEAHERRFIDPLMQEIGFTNAHFTKARPELYEQWQAMAPQVVIPGIHLSTGGLVELLAAGQPVHTMISGECADETVGCPMHTPDWSRACSPALLWRRRGNYPRGNRDLLSWLKYRLKDLLGQPVTPFPSELPDYLHPDVRQDYRDWWARHSREGGNPVSWAYLKQWLDQDGYLAMHWEYCSALNIRRVFPFFTREMLELTYSCHPAELIGPGVKKLLKRGLQGEVPAHVLARTDKGLRRPPATTQAAGPAAIPPNAQAFPAPDAPQAMALGYSQALIRVQAATGAPPPASRGSVAQASVAPYKVLLIPSSKG